MSIKHLSFPPQYGVRSRTDRYDAGCRGSGTWVWEVRAIAEIVAVLLRASTSNPDVDPAQAALAEPRIKGSVAHQARTYFGPPT